MPPNKDAAKADWVMVAFTCCHRLLLLSMSMSTDLAAEWSTRVERILSVVHAPLRVIAESSTKMQQTMWWRRWQQLMVGDRTYEKSESRRGSRERSRGPRVKVASCGWRHRDQENRGTMNVLIFKCQLPVSWPVHTVHMKPY